MKPRVQKGLALFLVATTIAVVPLRPARALSILGFGAEAEEIVAAIIALQTAVTNLQRAGNDIISDIRHVEQEMARDLGSEQFTDLIGQLRTAQAGLRSIQDDLERIGYSEATIESQFQRVFPQDPAAWNRVRYSDYDGLYNSWHGQIMASTTAAAHAQVALSNVRSTNERAAAILDRARTNHSEIQQLQTQNQMLAVVQTNLSSIQQSLASQGRVVAETAAISASEKQAARERNARRVEHYSDPHPSPVVLSRMPPVQGR